MLRDGAASQYGSDAIAGVINFVLKDDNSGMSVDAKYGRYFEGDGDGITLSGNIGLPLSDFGFANISLEWKDSDRTDRAIQGTSSKALIAAGNMNVPSPAQPHGSPEYSDDYKLLGNFGFDFGNGFEGYAFTNYAERQVETDFFWRNPHTRSGVFGGPEVDAMGNVMAGGMKSVKVADISGNYDSTVPNANCPSGVPIVNNVPSATVLATVRNNDDCYTLYEKFPGGFVPQFGGRVTDYAFAAGVRGDVGDWYMDISAVIGSSDAEFYIYDTINPQLLAQGNNIQTSYETGGYTETDYTINADFSRPFDVGFYDPLNVAFGFEAREEEFKITAGEPNSYSVDNMNKLPQQGFGIGSNGFSGFQAADAGTHSTSAIAAYVDLETSFSEDFLMQFALRYEDYDDFGDTTNGKLAMRYQINDTVALRGAFSTGFRVPTAGQANLRNVSTLFSSGDFIEVGTVPATRFNNVLLEFRDANDDGMTIHSTVQPTTLTPEESTNFTIGTVFEAGPVDFTIDYYKIEIEDRITFTSRFTLTSSEGGPDGVDNATRLPCAGGECTAQRLIAAGFTEANELQRVQFYSNEQTVETTGIDIVVTWPFDLGPGSSILTAAANFSEVNLKKFNSTYTSVERRREIEEGNPDNRLVLTWTHLQGPWRFMARVRHYGEYFEDDSGPNDQFRPGAKSLLDLEFGYDINDEFSLTLGVQNATDTYPDKNLNNGGSSGLLYPSDSPFGFNGGYYYLRANWARD